MKLWTMRFDESRLDNFPQVCYKGTEINPNKESSLVKEIFRIFYLTHRDSKDKIKIIENNKLELPYKNLYNMVFPPKKVEFETEYFVDLLNLFSIELEGF